MANPRDNLSLTLTEPEDGTVLVVRRGDAYEAIVRDDTNGAIRGRRWFPAANPDEPMTWRTALEYAEQVFTLGAPLDSSAPKTSVRVGQVWGDNDPRSTGRKVRVVEVDDTHATVEAYIHPGARHLHSKPPRRSRIRLDRFRPTATGYRLLQDAQEVPDGR
ncbi:hypothetical protein Sme01_03500 [Sphaerisporangium melleum]|uniref:Uncharacterized protein n=1 Tax=Sphaerisporangium melleum TaxID=321316 RepID=A0A917VC41_9ACTN|nr:hypothetical protein [Sphaerisporangium melleum]GGK61681.1 hypothetical protein GCM10007964_01050 [Sphaerisporangium melleum]GII67874.1 hypothetical protein Sme01_03500 [Sphaerisporangium melleum]